MGIKEAGRSRSFGAARMLVASVLAGLALSLLVNPVFIWLAGAIGLGLTIAGLTGFCGMALVMARMPWNRC